jgi:hypothetical protein
LHRVERFKYAVVFEGLLQGVREEAFFRDLNLLEKLRRGSAFEVFKGKTSEVSLKKEGHGEWAFIHFTEVLEETVGRLELSVENPQNSENHRIYRSCKVDKGRRTHHFGTQNQRGSLILICLQLSDHFGDSKFINPEGKPKHSVEQIPEMRKEFCV